MGGDGELTKIFGEAGFRDAKETRHTFTQDFPSEDAYFAALLEGTPVGHSLREEEEPVQRAVLAKAKENLRPWRRADGGYSLPAEGVVVTGRA
jgi:hypothetical protein